MICATAGLIVDLSEARTKLQDGYASARGLIHVHSDDPVRPGAEEQVAPLAANISHAQNGVAWQRLLDGGGIREHLFRQHVTVAVGAWLTTEIRIVDVVPSKRRGGVNRPGDAAGQRAAGAVRIDWLHLIFGLAGSIVIAAAEANDRTVVKGPRRPCDTQPWTEIQFRGVIPGRRVRQITARVRTAGQLAGVRVKQHEEVPVIVKDAVVFIPKTIVNGQIGPNFPLILRI